MYAIKNKAFKNLLPTKEVENEAFKLIRWPAYYF